MLNLLVVVSLSLVPPSTASVSVPESSAAPEARLVADGELRQTLARTEPSAAAKDVVRAYDDLRSMRGRERAQALAQMPSSTQSAIWAHHILTTLVKHPELTTEQRAVIQEALSLLTPELFEIDPSNPRWADLVDLPLRRLTERARAAFADGAMARDLFTQLGPEIELPNVHDQAAAPPTGRTQLIQTNSEDCSCNVISDWCYTGYVCQNAWCNFKNAGCGTLLRYPCDGLCFLKPH